MLSWTRGAPMEPDSLDTMSKSDILRGIIVEKLSTAAREILAVVERTVTDYEEEASGFRQEIDRQRRQLELLQPEIKQETSEEQQIFPVSETRGVEPLEEEELHKYKPSEGDTESLGIVCYTEQQVEEEEHEDEEEVEVDEDEEEEEEDQASLSSAPEPEYEAAPRLAPPSAPSDRRSVGRPRISDSQTLIDLRIRILEDSDIDVLSTGVFRKYPAHELQCPRGLQEEDFLELLRSSFPQLADGEPFDVFTTDRTKRLLPLEVDSLTPEEIYGTIRSSGNSALYIRLKKPKEVSSAEFDPSQIDAAAEPSSSSDQTRKHSRRKPGRPRINDTQTHIHLRIRILEDSQISVMSPIAFQKFPVQELQCARGLQESDFLDLLRSSFPQLADGEPFDTLTTDGLRRLQPLNVDVLTPEQIYRTTKSTGVPVLYIRLKHSAVLQTEEAAAVEDQSTPDQASAIKPVQSVKRKRGRPRTKESSSHVDLRIRILDQSENDMTTPGVFQKYPVHKLQCPRGLQEEDFLELLRSSFPQLADGEHFDVFTTDRTKRLLPLEVDSLTPDEINQVNRTNRNSALFIRLKTRDDVDVGENNLVPLQSDAAEDLPSFSEQTYRSPVHQGELGSNVLSNSSTSHPEHVEPEDGDDGEESSNLWFLMPSESDDVSDGEDDWRPRTSDERIRNGESDRTPGKQQLKARRTKQTASPLAEHSDTQLSCKVCRILRGSMNMLIKHAWSHVNERERICGVCGDQSESTEQLRSHLQTHQKTHSCNICGKSFITVSGFRGHIARHKGNTPYKCKICHKAFTEKSVLMNHRWVHTKDKPHKCDVCHKSYLSKLKLRDHRSTHTGGKLYGCNMCGKRFRSLDTLSGHMVLHSGHTAVRERRCVCEVCGKKFSTDKNLRIHMKNHSEDRPFACSKCNKSFSFKSNLATHMRVHTGEKPYQCPVCGKTFSQNHCVKRHLLKHRVQEMSPINGAAY
uniref:C2H2-type domain-containing protein n=1 Tax=Amphiprion ocellaris TaxID=80972 RepID=A0AAQ5YRV1_AMPOC